MSVDNDILALSFDLDKLKLEFNYLLEQGDIDKAIDKSFSLFDKMTDLQGLLLDKQKEELKENE